MLTIGTSVLFFSFKRQSFYIINIIALCVIWALTDTVYDKSELAHGIAYSSELPLWISVIILIVTVLNEVTKEFASKFHLIILSKPISRDAFLIGKILGSFMTAIICYAVYLSFYYISFSIQNDIETSFLVNVVYPFLFKSFYIWILCVFCCCCAVFMSEAFTVLFIGAYIFASIFFNILPLLSIPSFEVHILILKGITLFFPNLLLFQTVDYKGISLHVILNLSIYVMGMTCILLPISLQKFRVKSFT